MKIIILFSLVILSLTLSAQVKVERWKIFELILDGPKTGNPFTEAELKADFQKEVETITVNGFYDGNGKYIIRFMAQSEGEWSYITKSNIRTLNGKKGKFICIKPSPGNHGPVAVKDTFYFAYADGTPHHSFGTTCYVWVHQGDSLAKVTLNTLSKDYFNKVRFCIFPNDYNWNKNEPEFYPFEGKPLKEWDYTRFNPAFFHNIEKHIINLDSLGIEADLIIFHPYDRWDFDKMDRATDERYIKYITARLSAFKNVWWSMANEYDMMRFKKPEDWEWYLRLFAENDPYRHLIGIHNWKIIFNPKSPLITHLSVQNEETWNAQELRLESKKPVIYDECRYEGNIFPDWGNLTAQEMVNKFWRGVTKGGYVGHGDTYMDKGSDDSAVLWWTKGGVLKGESQERIKFLKEIIEAAPANLNVISSPNSRYGILADGDNYFLTYYNLDQSIEAWFTLPKVKKYSVEVIDTWEMTITRLPKTYSGPSLIDLPGKPGIALRITVL